MNNSFNLFVKKSFNSILVKRIISVQILGLVACILTITKRNIFVTEVISMHQTSDHFIDSKF